MSFIIDKTSVWSSALALIALVLVSAVVARGQTSQEMAELRRDIQTLQEGQEKLQQTLDELMQLARPRQQQDQFKEVELLLEGVPILGRQDAPVTLIEFMDYQCPFCLQHMRASLPQIEREYVETGKVRYAMKQFPLRSIHPAAQKAAEAALCAGDQGKFWEMHKHLFANQKELAPRDLLAHANSLGLNATEFQRCLDGSKYFQQVEDDLAAGTKSGVRGTPTLLLGLTDPEDETKLVATTILRGAQPYQAIKNAIESLLNPQEQARRNP